MPTLRRARPNIRRARDEKSSCGALGRRSRWWLWGVLPYLWLALFSEALHTHSPLDLDLPSALSTYTRVAAAGSAAGAQSGAARVAEAVDCLACQWVACSVALLGAALVLVLSSKRLVRVARVRLPVAARARRACSRGPPSRLMFAV